MEHARDALHCTACIRITIEAVLFIQALCSGLSGKLDTHTHTHTHTHTQRERERGPYIVAAMSAADRCFLLRLIRRIAADAVGECRY